MQSTNSDSDNDIKEIIPKWVILPIFILTFLTYEFIIFLNFSILVIPIAFLIFVTRDHNTLMFIICHLYLNSVVTVCARNKSYKYYKSYVYMIFNKKKYIILENDDLKYDMESSMACIKIIELYIWFVVLINLSKILVFIYRRYPDINTMMNNAATSAMIIHQLISDIKKCNWI